MQGLGGSKTHSVNINKIKCSIIIGKFFIFENEKKNWRCFKYSREIDI